MQNEIGEKGRVDSFRERPSPLDFQKLHLRRRRADSAELTAYQGAVEREYLGIALDLDGTALINRRELAATTKSILASMIRTGGFVVICTGRTLKDSQEAISQIQSLGRGTDNESFYVISHNGALTTAHTLRPCERYSSLYSRPLIGAESIIDRFSRNPVWQAIFEFGGKGFTSHSTPFSVTLKPNEGGGSLIDLATKVENSLRKEGFAHCKVLVSSHAIEIVDEGTDKATALAVLAARLGTDPRKVARVGDQGSDRHGNDFEFLNHEAGFSVIPIRESRITKAITIVDLQRAEVLEGAAAFDRLLQDLTIASPAFLPPAAISQTPRTKTDRLFQRHQELAAEARVRFSNRLRVMSEAAREDMSSWMSTDIVTKSTYDGLLSVFGSIRITASEIAEVRPGPLRDFLLERSLNFRFDGRNLGLRNIRRLQGGVFEGRAERYFTSMHGSEISHPPFDAAIERTRRELESLCELTRMKEGIDTFLGTTRLKGGEWKASLIFYDHLKASLLRLLHAVSYTTSLHLGKEGEHGMNRGTTRIKELVMDVVQTHGDLLRCNRPRFEIGARYWSDVTSEASAQLRESVSLAVAKGFKQISKAIRGAPESDNPLLNLVFADLVAEELHEPERIVRDFVLAGVHYGAIELPYSISDALRRRVGTRPTVIGVLFSKYSNPSMNGQDQPEIVVDGEFPKAGTEVFVLDDGALTGESLTRISTHLSKRGVNVSSSVQSVPSERRWGEALVRGILDPGKFSDVFRNSVSVTPFRRVMTEEQFGAERGYDYSIKELRTRRALKGSYPSKDAISTDPLLRLRRMVTPKRVAAKP